MIRNKVGLLYNKLLPYKSEIVWIVLGLFVQLFSGIFIIKILTNFLNTEDYGTFSLINSLIQFIEIVIFSSLIQGAGRYSYFLKDVSHAFELAKNLSYKLFYALAIFSTLLSIYFFFKGKYLFSAFCFFILILIFLDVVRDIYIGIFHMNRSRKVVTLFKSLDQILRMISVLFIGLLGFISLINIYFGFIIITLLLVYLLFKKKRKLQLSESVHFDEIDKEKKVLLQKKIVKFAIPFALTSIFTWLLTWADRWVLNSFLPIYKVGIYSANSQIANVPFMIISSIALTFFAPILFSKAEKIKTRIEFESYRTQINNILILYVIISFTSLGTVLISQNVILGIMLNAKYISNGYLFILISLGWLLYQIAQVHATLYLYTTSDSRAALISSIISGIFYLLLLILLVKSHNEIGAALAFIISNILRILFQIILSKRAWYNFKLRVMDVNITSLNN